MRIICNSTVLCNDIHKILDSEEILDFNPLPPKFIPRYTPPMKNKIRAFLLPAAPALRSLGVVGCLLLPACSYTPLYAPIDGQTLAGRVQVGAVEMERYENQNVGARRTAQAMSQRLRQDLPSQGSGMDTLTIHIREDASPLALRRTSLVEREQLTLTARVDVQDTEGKEVFKTEVGSTTAYNVETTPYATESGKVFARQTAARNLAEEILRRLNLFYRGKKS